MDRTSCILVVDDDLTNRMVVRLLMSRRGFSVHEAASGMDAIDKISSTRFSAVFMDLSMPGLDGFETTKLIRSQCGSNGDVPIIALTAHTTDKNFARCSEVGMVGFISKPFDPEQACTTLSLLSNHGTMM
ncbi:response regulator [Celeribacter marinus]|uniref:response regulator n=1 Tax=Celeribacter marinus TaxID=1397108 RepID=UPI00316C9036